MTMPPRKPTRSRLGLRLPPRPDAHSRGTDLLRAYLASQGISTGALGRAIGLRRGSSSVHGWARGICSPHPASRLKLFAVTGIPPESWDMPPTAEKKPL